MLVNRLWPGQGVTHFFPFPRHRICALYPDGTADIRLL